MLRRSLHIFTSFQQKKLLPQALSVDARQELDLKVGVAFSRFQTMFFQGKYGDLDSSILSYGPCQTPTLGFCVERHTRITSFTPEAFWVVKPRVTKGGTRLDLDWDRGRLFDQAVGQLFQRRVQGGGDLVVVSVEEKEDRRGRPAGLNTVRGKSTLMYVCRSHEEAFGPNVLVESVRFLPLVVVPPCRSRCSRWLPRPSISGPMPPCRWQRGSTCRDTSATPAPNRPHVS